MAHCLSLLRLPQTKRLLRKPVPASPVQRRLCVLKVPASGQASAGSPLSHPALSQLTAPPLVHPPSCCQGSLLDFTLGTGFCLAGSGPLLRCLGSQMRKEAAWTFQLLRPRGQPRLSLTHRVPGDKSCTLLNLRSAHTPTHTPTTPLHTHTHHNPYTHTPLRTHTLIYIPTTVPTHTHPYAPTHLNTHLPHTYTTPTHIPIHIHTSSYTPSPLHTQLHNPIHTHAQTTHRLSFSPAFLFLSVSP